jgi:hypothetical protein
MPLYFVYFDADINRDNQNTVSLDLLENGRHLAEPSGVDGHAQTAGLRLN